MGFGLFGKLPQKRDFVSVNLPQAVLHPFETWLQSAVAASRSEIGRGWEDYYLVAPIWRFWFGREVFGTVCAGALMASVDQVGRYFPLTIMYVTDRDEPFPPPLAAPLDDWYRAIESRLLSVLSADDRADIGNLLAGLPTPRQVQDAAPPVPAAPPPPPAAPPAPERIVADSRAAEVKAGPAVTAALPPWAVLGVAAAAPPPPAAANIETAPVAEPVPAAVASEPAEAAPAPIASPVAAAAVASSEISWDLPETPAVTATPASVEDTPAAIPATASAGGIWDFDDEPAAPLPEEPASPVAAPPASPPAAVPAAAETPTAAPAPAEPPRRDVLASPPVPEAPQPVEAAPPPPAAPPAATPPASVPAPQVVPPARVRAFEFKGDMFAAVDSEGSVWGALGELRDLDYRYAASGRSYWWCAASSSGSALIHATKGLPDPYFFSRMLMWKAIDS